VPTCAYYYRRALHSRAKSSWRLIVQPENSCLRWGEVPPEPDKSAPLVFMRTARSWPPNSALNHPNASDFSGSGGTSPHRMCFASDGKWTDPISELSYNLAGNPMLSNRTQSIDMSGTTRFSLSAPVTTRRSRFVQSAESVYSILLDPPNSRSRIRQRVNGNLFR